MVISSPVPFCTWTLSSPHDFRWWYFSSRSFWVVPIVLLTFTSYWSAPCSTIRKISTGKGHPIVCLRHRRIVVLFHIRGHFENSLLVQASCDDYLLASYRHHHLLAIAGLSGCSVAGTWVVELGTTPSILFSNICCGAVTCRVYVFVGNWPHVYLGDLSSERPGLRFQWALALAQWSSDSFSCLSRLVMCRLRFLLLFLIICGRFELLVV